MSVENKIPAWAIQERQQDLDWIQTNLERFWQTASTLAQRNGRGAIVVDAVAKPIGEGNLFTYFSQVEMERFEDGDIQRLVSQYIPSDEFVVVLLKPNNHSSSYQIRMLPPMPPIKMIGIGA